MSNSQKNITQTGDNILNLLNLLIENRTLSMAKIAESINEINCYECVSKYINTLRHASFIIIRKNRKYLLQNFPKSISDTNDLLETLIKIEALSKLIYKKEDKNKQFSFIEYIKPFLSKEYGEKLDILIKNEYDFKISKNKKMILSKFKEICDESQKFKIKYLNDDNQVVDITCEPYDVIYKKGQIYLNVFNLNDFERKLININFIKNLQRLPLKARLYQQSKNAKLMFMDKLAKSYTLKENEKIIQKNKDFIVISTTYDDKTLFMKSILRYGDLCKIISPNHLKETYIKYLSEMDC
ncbi:MAG: hypothetical protein WC197_01985 [Candidatus Gastranaerophilaceae bacterium]